MVLSGGTQKGGMNPIEKFQFNQFSFQSQMKSEKSLIYPREFVKREILTKDTNFTLTFRSDQCCIISMI